jgi:hypothetical protein
MSTGPVGFRPVEAPSPERSPSGKPPSRAGLACASQGDTVATQRTPPATNAARATLIAALLADVPPADRHAAQTAIPAILDAARGCGDNDPNRLGYFLATAQVESDFGTNMVESGHSRAWFERQYGNQDGNRPGTGDGFAYRGRGYVQTTRAGRYAELSHQLGLPDVPVRGNASTPPTAHNVARTEPALIADPDRLTDPNLAARALVIGVTRNLFTQNGAAALDKTIPVGRRPGQADFYHARALVNGIVKAQAQAVAHFATTYARVIERFGGATVETALRK